jgi:hypothetical protein
MQGLIIIAVAVLCVAALGVLALRRLSARPSSDSLEQQLQPVDLEAFLNLIDPAEDAFLREHLPPRVCATARRMRIRATLAYLAAVSDNVTVISRHAQQALASSDAQIAAQARKLVDASFEFRRLCTSAQVRLRLQLLVPGGGNLLPGFGEHYRALSSSFDYIRLLQSTSKRLASAG